MTRVGIGIAVLVAGLAAAGPSYAQLTIEVIDNGKPMRVTVSVVSDEGQEELGTTDLDGFLDVDLSAVDFGKGEEVAVWVRRCENGQVEVILAREGDGDPCAGGEAGEGCGCEKLAVVVWGDGELRIDVTNGTVDFVPADGAIGWRPNLTFGAKLMVANWMNLEDTVLQAPGATSAEVDRWTPGAAFLVETAPWGNRFFVGLEGTYSMINTQTQFGNQTQTGDITYLSVGPYARYNLASLDVGPMDLWFFGMAMAAYAWNMGDFTTDGLSEERDHDTWRGEFGGGLYHFSRSRLGFMLQALYSLTGDDPDAEEHIRFGAGIIFRPYRPIVYE